MLTARFPRPRRQRQVHTPPWLWFAPFVGAVIVRIILELGLLNLVQMLGIAVGVPLMIAFARRPGLTVRLLAVILPFQLMISAALYKLGLVGGVVRQLGLWKEVAAAGLVAAACVALARSPRRFDVLDRLALGFVALCTAYMLVPELFIGSEALGSTLSLDVRFSAWRVLAVPPLLLVAVRHIRLPAPELGRVIRVVIGMGITLGLIAVFEFVLSDLWNTLMSDILEVNRFKAEVLEVSSTSLNFDDIRTYGEVAGREVIRVGGPSASYLQFGFLLLVFGGLLFERLVRGAQFGMAMVGAVCLGAGVLVTQTRSAIVGAVLLVAVVLLPGAGRSSTSRIRYTLLAAGALVLVVPMVLGSGLSERFTAGDPQSDDAHERSFDLAFDVVSDEPFGRGLATGANAGTHEVVGSITAENQFLDVGLQVGWLGIALFVAILLAVIVVLYRAASTSRDPTAQTGVLGARNSFIALLVPMWYLHPFGGFEVAWVLFAIAGAALGTADAAAASQRPPHDDYAYDTRATVRG